MAANTVHVKIEVDVSKFEEAVTAAWIRTLVVAGVDRDEAARNVHGLMAAIKTATRVEACADDGHREVETTQLGQADRELRCTRCGNLRTEPREDRP